MLFGFAARDNKPPTNPQSDATPTKPGPLGPDDELLDEEEEESVGEEIGKTLVALMPWGISILFHVALVVVAFFLVWQTITQAEEEQPIVPSSKLADAPGAPEVLQQVQEQTEDASPTSVTDTPVTTETNPSLSDAIMPVSSLGVQFSGGGGGGPFSATNGTGEFGAEIFGNGGNARNIAIVVDASGSMVDVLPFVISELKEVVDGLVAEQNITIIFFSGSGVFEVPGGGRTQGLRPCTAAFKTEIREWVTLENFRFDTGGRGSQYAIAALERGLSYSPELLFLLSDNLTGGGQGATVHEIFQDDLMDAVRAANDGTPKAVINTIQFLYPDPLVNAGLTGTLDLLATETDGNYRFIKAEDLYLQ